MTECHQLIKSISWLIGTWLGKNCKGIYPTIKSFSYKELLEITHPASNQPVLHLKFENFICYFFLVLLKFMDMFHPRLIITLVHFLILNQHITF